MSLKKVSIKRFSLGSLVLWGFITAAIVASLPSLFCSLTFFLSLAGLRNFIGGLGEVGFSILGQKISFNLIDLLKLKDFYTTLNTITAWGYVGILLLGLAAVVALGIFGALVTLLLGALYNATGRLQLEVEETTQG